VLVVATNSLPPISVLNHPINLAFDKGSCDRTSLPAISSPSLLLLGPVGKEREGLCGGGLNLLIQFLPMLIALSPFQRANGACGQKTPPPNYIVSSEFSFLLSALFHLDLFLRVVAGF